MESSEFRQWAILEVMGHNTYAGVVSEETVGGASFVRVDIPEVDGQAAFSKLFGAASTLRVTFDPVAKRKGRNVDPVVRRFGAPGRKSEWLTPPEVLSALGPFDLDPCAPVKRPWEMAATHYTEGGLAKPWSGRVWLNPPYGPRIYDWVSRLAEHGNGIALIPARTETRGFHRWVWGSACAVFFFRGRLAFYNADGTVANGAFGAPCCLVAYGENNKLAIAESGLHGVIAFTSNV